MKSVNAYAAALAVIGLAVSMPAVTNAAFSSVRVISKTASATLTQTGSVAMDVAILKTADNTPDTQINWTGVTLPAGFVLASDYIQLSSTITASGGGIQTYTDNTAADASPKFSGLINSVSATPAGLVDNSSTTLKLPTAWTILHSSGVPVAANPNNAADPNSFGWLYHEDKAQVAVPTLGASAFVNGDPYITVENSNGIHFGQSPTQFGSAASPNNMYLEADFTSALTPRTYSTTTLRLEAFTE